MAALIHLQGITKTYHRGQHGVSVLRGVDLMVTAGERVALMGRSGSGKSTLLHILGCLDSPSSGLYCLLGQDVSTLKDDALSRLRNRTFGFVFQSFHLLPGLTVEENVALPMEYGDVSVPEQHRRALELLALVGLEHRVKHYPQALSGGERQRVAIARALANHPEILLADEPTGALDSGAREDILDLFDKVHRTFGMTQIVVTHDPTVAEQLGQRTLYMCDGRMGHAPDGI